MTDKVLPEWGFALLLKIEDLVTNQILTGVVLASWSLYVLIETSATDNLDFVFKAPVGTLGF